MRLFVILLCLIVTSKLLCAQENYPNCTHPKKIQIPFLNNSNDLNEIYYQEADEYTYWYQISASSECLLDYALSAIDDEDDYELLIYKSSGGLFCNDLINKKVKPVSTLKKGEFSLVKGDIYFFNVVYLNGNGCGHNLSLKTGENNLIIKAIQNECVEEVMEEIIEEIEEVIAIETKKELPELVDSIVKVESKVVGLVINSKTKKAIDATVQITAYNNIPSQQLFASAENGFLLDAAVNDKIIASVKKLGYRTFLDTIDVNSGSITIKLEPINIGEKLIMNKVYFYPNTYVLKEESKKELNKLLDFMIENKDYSFEIQGHTNGNRTVKKNRKYAQLGEDWNFKGTSKKLSKLRAEKIKAFLIKNGVFESQLQTEGYGGDKMIIKKPKNMSQAIKNIRVEVIVIQ